MKTSHLLFASCFTALQLFGLSQTQAIAGQLTLVAGGSQAGAPHPALSIELKEPFGVEFDSKNEMWIVEMVSGNRLLHIDSKGIAHHVAGQLTPGNSPDGTPALQAQFNGPHNLAIGKNDEVFIGDTWNKTVKVYETGKPNISRLASYETALDKHRAAGPFCITLDFKKENMLIADLRRVWSLNLSSGKATLIAGNGEKGIPSDGAVAAEAPLVDPRASAVDRQGNVYILERNGHALRVVSPDGKIKTVINQAGKQGLAEDGELAIQAKMNGPKHLCIDEDDSVLIADAENHVILRYQPKDGKVYRLAGTGKKGAAGVPGKATEAGLARPHGVTIHPVTKEVIITDSYNNRILKYTK